MKPGQRRLVWRDPRTGTEYDIRADDRVCDDKPWLSTLFVVRNCQTGEQASFPYESPEKLQEYLTGLVDVAEGFIRQRSTRLYRFARWSAGNRVLGTVARGARHLDWRKKA